MAPVAGLGKRVKARSKELHAQVQVVGHVLLKGVQVRDGLVEGRAASELMRYAAGESLRDAASAAQRI